MFRRIQLAWHVLRGRPLAYRIEFAGRGGVFNQLGKGKLVECVFTNDTTSPEAIAAGEAGVWLGQSAKGVEFKDVIITKLPPLQPGDVILNQEWYYKEGAKNDQRD